MIFDNSGFDSDDTIGLPLNDAVFKPFHCGFIIKNFRIVTDYDDPGTTHAIFQPYRVDSKTVGMISWDLRIQGSVMYAITTVFNWHMENIIIETQYLYRLVLARLSWGVGQTDLGTRTYFKNFTSINSGDKPSYLHIYESYLRMYTPNNVHFEDCYFDTYVGYQTSLGQFVFYNDLSTWGSEFNNTMNFTNMHVNTSRFDEGKDSSLIKTSAFGIARVDPITNHLHVTLTNTSFSNNHHNTLGNLVGWNTYSTSFIITGLSFLSSGGYLMNMNVYEISVTDLKILNATSDSAYLCNIYSQKGATLDGVTLEGLTDTGEYETALFNSVLYQDSGFSVRNVQISGSTFLNRRAVFYATGTSGSTFVAENMHAQDMTVDGDVAFIGYGIFKEVNVSTVHIQRAQSLQEGSNFIIQSDYSSEGLAPDNQQIIKNIMIEESTVSILSISKPDSLTNVTQSLSISNVTYKNSESPYSFDLFKIYKMSTVGSYTVTINDVSFSNLTYAKESKLMYLQQQLQNPVVISNLNISDIVFAGVTIEAYESNEVYNNTHVTIDNMKASNVDGYSRSLINLYKGADIEITNSEFSFIGNYDSGAVLSGGSDRAVVTFRNSTFWNNTSVEGGVFSTEAESNVKWYNWTLFNNFAISGGVVKVNADGMFKFYNSTIYNNFALAGAISELFSSQLDSVLDGSNITANFGVTQQQIETEVITQGNTTW